jgi:nucleotide-binding universal stress UspA family protein
VKPTLIVCAVDFSPEGRAVVTMAVRLARWYEAELQVAHLGSRVRSQNKSVTARAVDRELSARLDNFVAAVKAEGLTVETVILQGDAVSHSRLTLLHVLERAPHEGHNVSLKLKTLVPAEALNACDVDIAIEAGTPRDAILATAAALGADLIVIGQPRTTSHRVVMASTAGAVLRRAQCPVLTIPEARISEHMASRSTDSDSEHVKNLRPPATSDRLQMSNWADRWRETIHTMLRPRCPTPHAA